MKYIALIAVIGILLLHSTGAIPLKGVGGAMPSLVATGGPVVYFALAGMMVVTLLGSWGALRILNRWR